MPDTLRPQPPTLYRWTVIVFISAAMGGNYYIHDSINPLERILIDHLNFPATKLGWLNASYRSGGGGERCAGRHHQRPHPPVRVFTRNLPNGKANYYAGRKNYQFPEMPLYFWNSRVRLLTPLVQLIASNGFSGREMARLRIQGLVESL
jgi:hypothetical protein